MAILINKHNRPRGVTCKDSFYFNYCCQNKPQTNQEQSRLFLYDRGYISKRELNAETENKICALWNIFQKNKNFQVEIEEISGGTIKLRTGEQILSKPLDDERNHEFCNLMGLDDCNEVVFEDKHVWKQIGDLIEDPNGTCSLNQNLYNSKLAALEIEKTRGEQLLKLQLDKANYIQNITKAQVSRLEKDIKQGSELNQKKQQRIKQLEKELADKNSELQEVVEKQLCLFDKLGKVCASFTGAKDSLIKELNEKEQLRAELIALKEKLIDLKGNLSEEITVLQKQLNASKQANQDLSARHETVQQQLQTNHAKQITALNDKLDQSNKRLKQGSELNQKKQQRIEQLEKELADKNSELQEVVEKQLCLFDKLGKVCASFTGAKDSLIKELNEKEQLRAELIALKEKLIDLKGNLSEEITVLQKQLNASKQANQDLSAQHETVQQQLQTNHAKQITALNDKLDQSNKRLKQGSELNQKKQQRIEQLGKELADKNSELQEVVEKQLGLSDKISQAEKELTEARDEIKKILEQLRNEQETSKQAHLNLKKEEAKNKLLNNKLVDQKKLLKVVQEIKTLFEIFKKRIIEEFSKLVKAIKIEALNKVGELQLKLKQEAEEKELQMRRLDQAERVNQQYEQRISVLRMQASNLEKKAGVRNDENTQLKIDKKSLEKKVSLLEKEAGVRNDENTQLKIDKKNLQKEVSLLEKEPSNLLQEIALRQDFITKLKKEIEYNELLLEFKDISKAHLKSKCEALRSGALPEWERERCRLKSEIDELHELIEKEKEKAQLIEGDKLLLEKVFLEKINAKEELIEEMEIQMKMLQLELKRERANQKTSQRDNHVSKRINDQQVSYFLSLLTNQQIKKLREKFIKDQKSQDDFINKNLDSKVGILFSTKK